MFLAIIYTFPQRCIPAVHSLFISETVISIYFVVSFEENKQRCFFLPEFPTIDDYGGMTKPSMWSAIERFAGISARDWAIVWSLSLTRRTNRGKIQETRCISNRHPSKHSIYHFRAGMSLLLSRLIFTIFKLFWHFYRTLDLSVTLRP